MQKENKFFNDIFRFFDKEKGLTVTFGYLLLVVIGMIFKNNLYSRFNINIFDYADINDFVLAPLEDIRVLIFAFLSLFLTYFLVEYKNKKIRDGKVKENFMTKLSSKIHKTVGSNIIAIVGITYYVFFAANIYGKIVYKEIINQEKQSVFVNIEEEELLKNENPCLIGTTSKYTFFYLKNKAEMLAIPNDKIKNIRFKYLE